MKIKFLFLNFMSLFFFGINLSQISLLDYKNLLKSYINSDSISIDSKTNIFFISSIDSFLSINKELYNEIDSIYKANVVKSCKCVNQKFAVTLSEYYILDQKFRRKVLELKKNNISIDSLRDLRRATDIYIQNSLFYILDTIKKFPSSFDVGLFGIHTIFLIIQHSNLYYQKKYYSQLYLLANNGELPKSCIALLEDRINISENNKQKFGTQLKEINGKYIPFEVLNIDSLNNYRKQVGLDSIEIYWEKWGITIENYKSFYNLK